MRFSSEIRRIRLFLQGSRLLICLIGLAALASAYGLIFGLADALLAFEAPVRSGITRALGTVFSLVTLAAIVQALRVSPQAAAARVDLLLADPRHSASAAFSLGNGNTSTTPLAAWLADQARTTAATAIASIPAHKIICWRAMGIAFLMLLAPLATVGALRLMFPAASTTLTSRIFHPSADIPPYSLLTFTITPARPAAVYGGEIPLHVEISGPNAVRNVECLVRLPRTGEILRLPAFRESSTRYSRKLENLTEPIEVAFAVGKARSPWLPVEILLEPNILNGLVRISPPAHTGLAPLDFPLDSNEIFAVEGSIITLELTSNRPLASGTLDFTPAAIPGSAPLAQSTTTAAILAPHRASFTWTATRSGRLSATLRDLRGTPSPHPLTLSFRALPDLPPAVTLQSPPPMLLATPKSLIPVVGRADDDFSLAKIHLIRTLSGFRDRTRVVAPDLHEKSYDFSDQLDLDALGLEPGQTIEVMLDAADHNPSLLGQGSSEISRIRIISEDQYAEYIRAKTTTDQFANRFRAARDALDSARQSLETLRDAVEQNDPAAIEKAAAAAHQAHEQAAELMDRIARDFQAFDLEKRLRDLAQKQADDLRANELPLRNFAPNAPKAEQQAAIEEMLRRLERQAPEARQLDEDATKVRQAAEILEMAAKFRQILEAQKSLVKRFGAIVDELRRGEDQNRRMLPLLAETQEKNREALDAFQTELRRRIEALPQDEPDLEPLLESALKFLQDLEAAAPGPLMDAAARHGKDGQAPDALVQADRARAALEELLAKPELFAEAAKGKAPQFNIPRQDVNRNLQQLLEALLGQNPGQGEGNEPGGQGLGGQGTDLAAASGFSMDLPVVGPDRLQFSDAASSSEKAGGHGKATPPPPLPESAESSTLPPTPSGGTQTRAASPEAIPEPYRDAVKKFLTH